MIKIKKLLCTNALPYSCLSNRLNCPRDSCAETIIPAAFPVSYTRAGYVEHILGGGYINNLYQWPFRASFRARPPGREEQGEPWDKDLSDLFIKNNKNVSDWSIQIRGRTWNVEVSTPLIYFCTISEVISATFTAEKKIPQSSKTKNISYV